MRIDTSKLTGWKIATKTKELRAKPMGSLFSNLTPLNKFLLNTLEGVEPVPDSSILCVGSLGDVWQQTPKKLLAEYNVTHIESDGWLICEPKPNNAVNCVEVDRFLIDALDKMPHSEITMSFTIIGHYGQTIGDENNVQTGEEDDYICQNLTDPTDVWIVKRNLFQNTYIVKE